jgi:hypothetical protein
LVLPIPTAPTPFSHSQISDHNTNGVTVESQSGPPAPPKTSAMNLDGHLGPHLGSDKMYAGNDISLPNGQRYTHQPHLSNGSLQFGGFQTSTSSSPAPMYPGGFAAPPGIPNQPFAPNVVPHGPDFVPTNSVDGYTRAIASFSSPETIGQPMNTLGPSTPHSFQESRSSGHPEEMPYGYYPNAPLADATGMDYLEDMRSRAHPSQNYGGISSRIMPPIPGHLLPMNSDVPVPESLATHLRSQFGDPALADCMIELRYADDRAAPARIYGHKLILTQNPKFQSLLGSDNISSSPNGSGMRLILLQSDDKYLESTAFHMAVHRLYGGPLLPLPQPLNGADSGHITYAGNTSVQFGFALAYAAAGHLISSPNLVRHGLEIATCLLNWETIESALTFVLGRMKDRASVDHYTMLPYGTEAHILMRGIIHFIVNEFPKDFILDTSVEEPEGYNRLPQIQPLPKQPVKTPSAPAIVRGTSVPLKPGRRSRLSRIKFGDLSPESGSTGDTISSMTSPSSTRPTTPSQRRPLPAHHIILSRILINLPFAFLKDALESTGHGSVSGWASTDARHHTIKDVVAERELRRLQTVEALKTGRITDAEQTQHMLQKTRPQPGVEGTALGWQEFERPHLVREWVPLILDGLNNANSDDFAAPSYP